MISEVDEDGENNSITKGKGGERGEGEFSLRGQRTKGRERGKLKFVREVCRKREARSLEARSLGSGTSRETWLTFVRYLPYKTIALKRTQASFLTPCTG